MTTLSILVGKRIKEVRESKNIKQIELANLLDIEATNLSKIEKGIHLPKEDTLNKIIKALNINIEELFDFKHLQSREVLLSNIYNIFENLNDQELQFFYKILHSFKELKK